MHHPLCDKYGFSETVRKARLSLLGFDASDQQLAELFQREIITQHNSQIIDAFYGYLLSHQESAFFLKDASLVEKLKVTHAGYLESFGLDCAQADYFEYRLQVGLAHARIGLPLSIYLAAYRLLNGLLVEALHQVPALSEQDKFALQEFIHKVIMLDIGLATETYQSAVTSDLRRSLAHLEEETQELSSQVNSDELTTLASRRYLLEVIRQHMQESQETHMPLSIAMADLDFFKKINDQHGHVIGDRVLMEVSLRLKGAVRDGDTVGRYGGEEFVIVMPMTSLHTSLAIAERIRQHVGERPLHINQLNLPLTISLGVAEYQPGDSVESLIERADQAMYIAKQAGRNRVESL